MKRVESLVVGIIFLALQSACGKVALKERVTVQGQLPNTTNFDAETAYRNLPAPDYSLIRSPMMTGGGATQRQAGSRFCRKSAATVPNPVYSYACWELYSTDASAQSTYQYLAAVLSYSISFGNFGGAIQEAISADESVICQKTTVTSPGALPSFECFRKL